MPPLSWVYHFIEILHDIWSEVAGIERSSYQIQPCSNLHTLESSNIVTLTDNISFTREVTEECYLLNFAYVRTFRKFYTSRVKYEVG